MLRPLKLPPIEHSTYIAVLPERVYKTLTTGKGWDAWFTSGTTINARVGGSIRLRWKNFGAGGWTMEDGGPVVAADPGRRLAFEWSPSNKPTTVDIRLQSRGHGTI